MNTLFSVGEIVMLKSQDKTPKMVIEKITSEIGTENKSNDYTITCIYWSIAQGTYLKKDFLASSLKRATSTAKS